LKDKITLEIKDDAIKIYFDGILHLCISKQRLLAVQSWITPDKYTIEFYMQGNSILCEYENKERWETILSLLSEKNLFNKNF
jgi:hypothetical protein